MKMLTEKANLPIDCSSLIIGERYSGILDLPLKSLNISPVYVPNNPFVDERLSGHADLSVFHAGGENIFLAPYLRDTVFAENLTEIGFKVHFSNIKQSKKYPFDSSLNVCCFGNTLICSKNISDAEVIEQFEKTGERHIIYSRQGYARCSVCIVDENSVITADRGIYNAAVKAGIDVLLIEQGYVELTGFEYGFLGGASFKISKNKLCFTGTLDAHHDKERILEFLNDRKIEPVFLTDKPVFDIGSAIPILEK